MRSSVCLLLLCIIGINYSYAQNVNVDDSKCGVATSWFPLIVSKEKVNDAEYPWMAALYVFKDHVNNYDFLCTTTLISKRHVITAGHCLQYESIILYDEADLVLVFGKTDLTNWARGSEIRQVSTINTHPNYTQSQPANDLVILTFEKPVLPSTTIYPICLWHSDWKRDDVLGSGIVAGWGKNNVQEQSSSSVVPYKITMPMIGQDECKNSKEGFANMVSEFTFCAGERNGMGPCGGDTGAGYVVKVGGRHYLRGIVSHVERKSGTICDLSQYVIFSDLSKEVDWIKSIIESNVAMDVPKPETKKKVTIKYKLNYHADICGIGSKSDSNYLQDGDYPWVVAISMFDGTYTYKCMGTLLTPKHVITVAQCIKNLAGDTTPNFRFLLNFKPFNNTGYETGGALRLRIHKEYTRPPANDIAIMILFMPVKFTENIKPICLWEDNDETDDLNEETGVVVGYKSHIRIDVYKTTPEVITLPIVTNDVCLKLDTRYTTLIKENTFCAGNLNESIPVPCTGHAGSGLMVKHNGRWTLRGIVSTALPNEDYTDCDRNKYVMLIDVTKYRKWISEALKID